MAKRLRQFVGCILVIANILSSNAVILAEDFVDTEPTETVAVETEEAKEESKKVESKKEPEESTKAPVESSESSESSESETSEPTPASAQDREDESMPSESSESSESAVSEETSETTEDTVPTPAEPLEGNTVKGTITRTIIDTEGKTYKVTASYDSDTGIPDDAELVVEEIISGDDYDEYYNKTVEALDGQDVGYVRFFDISIVKDGVEYEPAEGTTVNVKIQLEDTLSEELSIVHFADDAEPEVVETTSVKSEDGTEIVFEADGFSAYAIVEGPEPYDPASTGWRKITSLDEIPAHADEIYVGHPSGYYFTGDLETNVGGNAGRTGITKTQPAQTLYPSATSVPYVFEAATGTNKYYIHTKEDTPKYILQNGNSLSFVDSKSSATAFTIGNHSAGAGIFYAQGSGTYCINQQGNEAGKAFAAYTGVNDKNAKLNLWYYVYSEDYVDPLNIDGLTRGLMFYDSGVSGKGLMGNVTGNNLGALAMPVLTKQGDHSDQLFVPNDKDLTMWTFEWFEDNRYYIRTVLDGTTYYLNITDSGLALSTTHQPISVVPGTGNNAGKISLEVGANHVSFSGTTTDGFKKSTAASDNNKWLNLVDLSDLTSDYMIPYSARKVSVSDPKVTNGSKVIIYTRTWNETSKKYEFYAVNHDGTLFRVYEEGDEIQWIDDRINTLLWDFTAYYWEDEEPVFKNENGYYELFNEYSENYICPHADSDDVFSTSTIGLNLNGRKDKAYYTPIIAWDDDNYAYAGVRTDTDPNDSSKKRIIAYPLTDEVPADESKDFYFAIVQEVTVNEKLHPVTTLNNDDYGIKMKMIDFTYTGDNWKNGEQCTFLDDNSDNHLYAPKPGLLSTDLGSDGYPKNGNGQSMANLYVSSRLTEVNHLFADSTYKSSGYFEFDSTQNFATLIDENGQVGSNFTVYQELGTNDSKGANSMKHGQFLPYNTIQPGVFSKSNPENMYDALQRELPDTDPRKHENLHLIKETPNYAFGLELEASFVQTPNGLDDWGHDIIYEFTGDDDFWLYVDGELVIDLGGNHSALSGSINYRTGEVVVNGEPTTLYDLFRSNYEKREMSQQEIETKLADNFKQNSQGQYIFKDYTKHTMRVFYMERGKGASNLHMRFNQSSVRPGTVILSKELRGVENAATFNAEFPFQIFYQPRGEEGQPPRDYEQITNQSEDIHVYYRGTNTPVKYVANNYVIDGLPYEGVFFLKPGESCEIIIPDNVINYYVKECGVSPDIYDMVKCNGEEVTGVAPANPPAGFNRLDYAIPGAPVKDRTSVEYENYVDQDALRTLTFQKKLYDEHGIAPENELRNDETPFDFRLYFATEHESSLTAANMYTYHVKDPDGNYCCWDSATKKFVKIGEGITDYSQLSADQKKSASFSTSMYGSVSKIPAFYYVEIRELLAGAQYQVEERYTEIPDGYSRYSYYIYEDDGDTTYTEDTVEAVGTVENGKDPFVIVNNLRGYGIRIYKDWTDQKYVSERDATYFAAYVDDTLIPQSIYRLKFTKNSLYWYFASLESGKTLDNYHIREVSITDPVVDESTGEVTSYSSITPVAQGGEIKLNGKLKGDTDSSEFTYNVNYAENTEATGNNIRIDRITNSRAGIDIYKEDMHDNPLEGAVFDLYDNEDKLIGSFSSDDTGFVTTAYLRKGINYTLVEKKSPAGFAGLKQPLTVRMNNDGTIVVTANNTTDQSRYEYDAGPASPEITVKNIRYNFSVSKKDKATHDPVEGVEFALHRQRTVGSVTVVDFNPMAGYEHLYTDVNGIVPRIDNTLAPGTYELREISTPSTHHGLSYYVRFTVTETGDIRLNEVHPEVQVLEEEVEEAGEKRVIYTLLIYNNPVSSDLSISKKVAGNMGNKTEEFPMTVKLTDASNNPYVGTFYTQKNNGTTETRTLSASDLGIVRITLSHEDTIVFTGLDEHTKFTVTEDTKGYQSDGRLDGVHTSDTGTVSGNIDDNHFVLFINTREGVIPTGLETSFNLSVSTLCALTAGVAVSRYFFFRRRREEEES